MTRSFMGVDQYLVVPGYGCRARKGKKRKEREEKHEKNETKLHVRESEVLSRLDLKSLATCIRTAKKNPAA